LKKKTRRIEIKAFRRTTVLSGDQLNAGFAASPERQEGEPSPAEALSEGEDGFDLIKSLIASIERSRSSGSDQTIEVPVPGNRDSLTSTPVTKPRDEIE
jgi:hypothetical protein